MSYVKNSDQLTAGGDRRLRGLALEIAEAGIAAAHPGSVLRGLMRLERDHVVVDGRRYDLTRGQRVFVVGAGKATYPIAEAIEALLGDRIDFGLVVCKRGQQSDLRRIEMIVADHPIPTQASLDAARATEALLLSVRPGDVVISCFTGGSSSLFVSPVDGVSLADKAETSRVLLTCGANVVEINKVRKHLSKVKGGRLARALPAGTHLLNLTVSDVIGERLEYITDPSVPDTSSFDDARATLDKFGLWDRLPSAVTRYLRAPPPGASTVDEEGLAHVHRQDVLLVATDAACEGAASAARRLGFQPVILSTFFEGESSSLGRTFAAIARQVIWNGRPVVGPCALIGGGETTVTITGEHGLGGPNQEFAVAAALEIAGCDDIVALGLDTDGTDGPTPFAGGMVDGHTVSLSRGRGIDLHDALRRHDVSNALDRSGHAILTGNTGTNVNDLKLALVGTPGPSLERLAG